MDSSRLSRRMFIGGTVAMGLSPLFLQGCSHKKVFVYANTTQVIVHSALYLFPHSPVGPGAEDLHIASYINFVLGDERILAEDREYFLKGGRWLEESAFETFEKSFLNLDPKQKEELFTSISKQQWGENFIYTLLSYTFEALLSAPVYGSNPDETGWKWLSHDPGFPQPSDAREIVYGL